MTHADAVRHFGTADELSPEDRAEVPEPTLLLFEEWSARLEHLPESLEWARDSLRAREPILERACMDEDRVYWSVRFPLFGEIAPDQVPPMGATGLSLASSTLPEPLQWLAETFGTLSIEVETSGTAPLGWSVAAMRRTGNFFFSQEYSQPLPPEADEWVALYEADGDVLVADLVRGNAIWLGHEWTGETQSDMGIGWEAALHFILWRMLDGGYVRPGDLEMLAAATGGS